MDEMLKKHDMELVAALTEVYDGQEQIEKVKK